MKNWNGKKRLYRLYIKACIKRTCVVVGLVDTSGDVLQMLIHMYQVLTKILPSHDMSDKDQNAPQPNNPMHGVKLKDIVEYLVVTYGWAELGDRISIRCFTHEPSVSSSLKFLRRTPWARSKVEALYLESIKNH